MSTFLQRQKWIFVVVVFVCVVVYFRIYLKGLVPKARLAGKGAFFALKGPASGSDQDDEVVDEKDSEMKETYSRIAGDGNGWTTAMKEYGGMYLDFDQLLLNPFDDLLNKSTVMGIEKQNTLNNALFLAEPNAEFLRIWLSKYTTFNDKKWGDHSTLLPNKLYRNYPHLVHLEDTFFKAQRKLIRQLYRWKSSSFNWTRQYGFHFYKQGTYQSYIHGPRLDYRNCVIGDMVRYVMYGDRRACMKRGSERLDKDWE